MEQFLVPFIYSPPKKFLSWCLFKHTKTQSRWKDTNFYEEKFNCGSVSLQNKCSCFGEIACHRLHVWGVGCQHIISVSLNSRLVRELSRDWADQVTCFIDASVRPVHCLCRSTPLRATVGKRRAATPPTLSPGWGTCPTNGLSVWHENSISRGTRVPGSAIRTADRWRAGASGAGLPLIRSPTDFSRERFDGIAVFFWPSTGTFHQTIDPSARIETNGWPR